MRAPEGEPTQLGDSSRSWSRSVSWPMMVTKDAFSQWLGLEVVDVRPRRRDGAHDGAPEMVNGFGVCARRHRLLARRQRARVRLEHARQRHGEHRERRSPIPPQCSSATCSPRSPRGERRRTGSRFYRVTVRNQNGRDRRAVPRARSTRPTGTFDYTDDRMNDAYIIDGVRTAIGNIGGALSEVRADDLAAHVIASHAHAAPCVDPRRASPT